MDTLTDLPDLVLNNVLYFSPPELLLNLARTNFRFYEPCLRKLYKRLVIQVDPVIKFDNSYPKRQRMDHISLSCTPLTGFASVSMKREAHLKMVAAKLKTIARSVATNHTLATYIEEIEICGTFDAQVNAELKELFAVLASIPNSIHKIYIANAKLRKQLGYHELKNLFALQTITVESSSDLIDLRARFPKCHELIIANFDDAISLPASTVVVFERLTSLKIRNDPIVFDTFTSALQSLYNRVPFVMTKLKTVNIVQTHETASRNFPYFDFGGISNFQVSLGCDDIKCEQKCLEEGLSRYEEVNPKRLAFIQNSNAQLNSHKYTETWDLRVFQFVKNVVENFDALFYLSIRHNVPGDGIIDDGFEGNYLRKVKLYTFLLPNLLATIQKHVVNLVLPNLVASLACYEQPMNTFLWNGCQCPHCAKYLQKLDDYMLYHRYYNTEKGVFKDILTTQLVRSMSDALENRIESDPNLGDLSLLSKPMKNSTWDFHASKFSPPFFCLPVKNFEMGYFEDDGDERSGAAEKFFDAESKPNDCKFLNHEKFVPNYLIVISHFLNDIIRKMINLNRGNAEDVKIGQKNDENDGFTNLRINKMLINGIDYNFDHEINGTIFYVNSYDGTNLGDE